MGVITWGAGWGLVTITDGRMLSVVAQSNFYKPAVHKAQDRLVLRLLSICLWFFVSSHIVCNNYITYIVAMRLYLSQPRTAALSTGVATMSSLAQLRDRDTKKKGQRRCDDAR